MPMDIKNQIRQQKRSLRRQLNAAQQQQASQALVSRLNNHPYYQQSNTIALYLDNDGEISVTMLAEQAWQNQKKLYLPVLDSETGVSLVFKRWLPTSQFQHNRFNIPEPVSEEQIDPRALDLVCLPLVAFDANGGRLGMGGGFYDRTFEFITTKTLNKPVLWGMAHECQRVAAVPKESWDIPLSSIVTDQHWYGMDG